MSRINPNELRTEPLPSLPERRRSVRERLAKAEAEYEKFTRALSFPLSPSAATLAMYMASSCALEIKLLHGAIAYLGEPDERLDLYRTFLMNLPPE
jgi:hypothetical protein